MIPPKQSAEFVARMPASPNGRAEPAGGEDVLEVYRRPYDPQYPVVNMDERPVQFVRETRTPLPARPGSPRRYDYEYERAGTASVFLFTEALHGWRKVSARPRRTAVDWAEEVRSLLEEEVPRSGEGGARLR